MSRPRVTYTARPDATPEGKISALASVYAFVLRKHRERQKAAGTSGGEDDPKGAKHDRANPRVP